MSSSFMSRRSPKCRHRGRRPTAQCSMASRPLRSCTGKPGRRRIHTVPRRMTIRQWNRDHCSRSRRAGTFVVMAQSPEVVVMLPLLPPRDTADPPYGRGTGLACRIRRNVSPRAALPSRRTPVPLPERGRHRAPALQVRLRGARQKRCPSAEDAERYARAYDHEDAEDLGRRAPLVGLFPLRLLRAVRPARARRASAAPDDGPCHLETLPCATAFMASSRALVKRARGDGAYHFTAFLCSSVDIPPPTSLFVRPVLEAESPFDPAGGSARTKCSTP